MEGFHKIVIRLNPVEDGFSKKLKKIRILLKKIKVVNMIEEWDDDHFVIRAEGR